jgi:hypothetical protein
MKDMKIMKGREFSNLSNKVEGNPRGTAFDLYEAGEHQTRLPNQLPCKAIKARVKKLCFMNRHNITREVNAVLSSSPSCSSW